MLIRLFAVTDGYPISVKNEFLKNIFLKKKKKDFFKIIFNIIGYPQIA